MILPLLLLLPSLSYCASEAKDPCTFVSDDYCFHFGQSSCYMKICECELKNCTYASHCTLSPWCDPSGKTVAINETFTDIDRGCDSLKHNCLTQSQNHGYCFLYLEGCAKSDEVQKKIGREALKNSRKDCPRWKRKCATKYPKHFTCRMYKRKCGPIDFPINNNSTNEGFSSRFNELIDDDSDRNDTKVSPKLLRLCSQWQRKCEEKYPRHFACRQFKRKCRSAQQQLHLNNELNTSTSTMNTTSNESTESNDDKDEGKILEQCQQWERICAKKDPEHHSCRQYRGKCRLADEHSNDSSTTKPLRQNTTKSIASKNATSTDIDSDIDNESEQLSDSIELDS